MCVCVCVCAYVCVCCVNREKIKAKKERKEKRKKDRGQNCTDKKNKVSTKIPPMLQQTKPPMLKRTRKNVHEHMNLPACDNNETETNNRVCVCVRVKTTNYLLLAAYDRSKCTMLQILDPADSSPPS